MGEVFLLGGILLKIRVLIAFTDESVDQQVLFFGPFRTKIEGLKKKDSFMVNFSQFCRESPAVEGYLKLDESWHPYDQHLFLKPIDLSSFDMEAFKLYLMDIWGTKVKKPAVAISLKQ